MNFELEQNEGRHDGQSGEQMLARLRQPAMAMNAVASSAVVNRTHRVVRERAKTLQARRKKARSLWIPLTVSFGFLMLLGCALWSLMDEQELFQNGVPDSSQQMLVLSMWFLPLSVVLLAVVWFRRARASDGGPR